jgi:hypothetical protein
MKPAGWQPRLIVKNNLGLPGSSSGDCMVLPNERHVKIPKQAVARRDGKLASCRHTLLGR